VREGNACAIRTSDQRSDRVCDVALARDLKSNDSSHIVAAAERIDDQMSE
jgi:hypothetical protein